VNLRRLEMLLEASCDDDDFVGSDVKNKSDEKRLRSCRKNGVGSIQ
jgi:hypothetical protein